MYLRYLPQKKKREPTPTIDVLEEEAGSLEEEGKVAEALSFREKALFKLVHMHGVFEPQVRDAAEQLVLLCNTTAMSSLHEEGKAKSAVMLLKKAERLTSMDGPIADRDLRLRLRAVTLNNLGCFYKQ